MAVTMEARMRAIEQWITVSAISALDDHALKLDTLKAGQAHLGGLTFEGLEFAEIVQKVSESADNINQVNLQVGLMQQALDPNDVALKAAVQANNQALKARLESYDSEIKQQFVIQQQRADKQGATLRAEYHSAGVPAGVPGQLNPELADVKLQITNFAASAYAKVAALELKIDSTAAAVTMVNELKEKFVALAAVVESRSDAS